MGRFLNSIFGSDKNAKGFLRGEEDIVVELKDVPQSDVGAPLPVVLSNEHRVLLAYRVRERDDEWDGSYVRIVDYDSPEEPIAIVNFGHCHSFIFGAPNDETFNGHPLYEKGLHPYGVFEVGSSSWLKTMERRNSVHEDHDPNRFHGRYKHFVFAFHDSTFECLAEGFEVQVGKGSIESILSEMQRKLFERK